MRTFRSWLFYWPGLCLIFFFIFLSWLFFQIQRLDPPYNFKDGSVKSHFSTSSIKKIKLLSDRSTNRTNNANNSNYIRQLHLCSTDFQKSFELPAFNRTLILYEVEWRDHQQINILLLLVENIKYPLNHIGNLTPHFNNLYSIQCLYQSKLSKAHLHHLNVHEFDRTVIIQCENNQINNSQITLLFTQLSSGKISKLNIHLCWSLLRKVAIGHCHKALFGNIPFHIIQQWIDYHLLIGVEIFYIYDRTLKYKKYLQTYINRGEVVYIPFPLTKHIVNRERFNWIDQFVGKMHCLMHIRSSFQWLGTWDIDEYLDFYSNQSQIFPFHSKVNQKKSSHSMLNQYLDKYFKEYDSIVLKGLNYMGKQSVSIKTNKSISSSSPSLIIKQFQHRLTTWNDRQKYLTRPSHTDLITIHYASLTPNRFYYGNNLTSPTRDASDDPRKLIRINHYPSAEKKRDESFLFYHNGSREYVHDPVLWQVAARLREENKKKT